MHALTGLDFYDQAGAVRPRPFTLADVEAIGDRIRQVRAVLAVIDVLSAYLPSRTDAHADHDVRTALAPVAAMAEQTRCCVVLLRHLNKSIGGPALYRGGGSIGIVGAARAALIAAYDPEDESRRVLAMVKSNLGPVPPALAYQLIQPTDHGAACVEWLGRSEYSAQALVSAPRSDSEREEDDELVTALRMMLDDAGGEIEARDAVKRLRVHGFTPAHSTLHRARRRAGIVSRKSAMRGGWMWSYRHEDPTEDPEDPEDPGADGPRAFGIFTGPEQLPDSVSSDER